VELDLRMGIPNVLFTFIQTCRSDSNNIRMHSFAVLQFRPNFSTRSPFVILLSRRAQYGSWSSFGKRVWFTESHLVLIIYFFHFLFFIYSTYCLYKINGALYPLKQPDHFLESDTVTSLYSYLHLTRTRLASLLDC